MSKIKEDNRSAGKAGLLQRIFMQHQKEMLECAKNNIENETILKTSLWLAALYEKQQLY